MKSYLRLLTFVKPCWKLLALAALCAAFVSLMTALYAWLVRPVLDDIFIKKESSLLRVIYSHHYGSYSSLDRNFSCSWIKLIGEVTIIPWVGQYFFTEYRIHFAITMS